VKVYLISGTRHLDEKDWRTADMIREVLAAHPLPGGAIHGACEGVDWFVARQYINTLKVDVISMRAQWVVNGKKDLSAGPKRNSEMVTVVSAMAHCGWEPLVLAFPRPDSRGTRDLIWKAAKAGLPVVVTELGGGQ
jgi:hypothetical protein